MNVKPQKMWVKEKRDPTDKARGTIFANDKELKDQYINHTGKRWLQDIKDQTSFVFQMDKRNYDRSLVVAPTKQHRYDRYYQLKDNPHKQRETIFSTPAVLNKINKYKSLDSKKHYSNIQASTNMSSVLDYNYVNTQQDRKVGKKRFDDGNKNNSSVGNPILSDNGMTRTSSGFINPQDNSRGIQSSHAHMRTTGNLHLDRAESSSRLT